MKYYGLYSQNYKCLDESPGDVSTHAYYVVQLAQEKAELKVLYSIWQALKSQQNNYFDKLKLVFTF